ncbi:FosX/FosE/FosI family fosfomycin resistance thiol transferase [Leptolyngbya sp. NK1-12]|uniref:FosX/FosE/FosI family fosfomycin resistance thiol transferase n=1 Tax=Leptolyngbya sp. NK1-12 TaxID=2547451 RepID=A0AA96WKX6_9CYAN|nr:FosX/FosE/FosI family fosfomycin resistance hydrolase [Leptolyngbya sp. NK1-12]WNZ27004.1 FosX/FosE/FosI family fosfomycin resistance thiol transferase [Leptolyngbya sp. NK1-12]
MIEGLSHITFIVRDLDRMTQFLTTIFDAKEVYASGEATFSIAREKFFLINQTWIAVMEGAPLSERSYNHVAFKIPEPELKQYAARIRSLGIEPQWGRSRIPGEGQSLYFYDDDNHLFELHTGTLEQRLASYQTTNSASVS